MKKIFTKILFVVISFLIVSVSSFILWGSFPMPAEKSTYEGIVQKEKLSIIHEKKVTSLSQKGSTSVVGIIYYPGARVASDAYMYKLGSIVLETDVKVFITKPLINFAIFGINDATQIIKDNPGITSWYLAGHSLGGAIACQYVSKHTNEIKGLLLFGSYCAADISNSNVKVFSISGSRDGLSTPRKIDSAKKFLPTSSTFVVIEGANHAQMGNYGKQKGDLEPEVSDQTTLREMTKAVTLFLKH